MALFEVTDPETGITLELEGDSPPTEQELIQVFSSLPSQTDAIAGIGEELLGVAETGLAIGGGALGEAAGGLIGGARAAIDLPTQEAQQLQEGVSDIFAFEPRTAAGKRNLRAVGENEFVKQIGGFLKEAERIGGEFGFNLLQPIAQELNIPGIAGAGGAVGAAIPAGILELFPALAAGKAIGAGARGAARATGRAAEVAPKVAEAGRELVPVAAEAVREIFEFQTPAKKRLTELIQSGSTDVETARFELTPSPLRGGQRLKADKVANETLRQGFDEGVIAAVKQAQPADKAKMLEMTNIMQKGKKNARFAAQNRPSDVAGNTLLDRFKIVRRANIEAGQQIGNVAKSLKGKDVDPTPATDLFISDLDEMGISPTRNAEGDLELDFAGSDIEGLSGPINAVNNIFNRMTSAKKPDAFELHRLKRFIDEQVTFGKNSEGLAGRAEIVLKNLRRNIDGILDTNFPEYDKVNTTYSETISALDAFQDVAGKKMNLIGPNAEKAVGTLLRRTLSNAQSRVRLLDSIDEIERTAKKFADVNVSGVKRIGKETEAFTDDLLNQVLFVDELDRQFGAVARTSFQGQIEQGIKQAARGREGLREAAFDVGAKAIEKGRGINDENAFKAIKDLLREGTK